jgi:phosphoglycerate dehydrogenase-like enzyme
VTRKRVEVVFVDVPQVLGMRAQAVMAVAGMKFTAYETPPYDDDEIVVRARDADVIVVDPVTNYRSHVLRRLPRLQVIVTTSVDTDHIDLQYCRSNGIEVINFPGFNARAAAEAALTFALALMRGLPTSREVFKRAERLSDVVSVTPNVNVGEMAGRCLGVIGAGSVGAELISLGRSTGMTTICHTKHPGGDRARRLGLKSFTSLKKLLSDADLVVLAVDASTDLPVIGAEQLNAMRPEAILVNVGAWQAVDLLALADAIYRQRIAGAAIDCHAPGPPPEVFQNVLVQEMLRSPNVLFSPDLSSATDESAERLAALLVEAFEDITRRLRR